MRNVAFYLRVATSHRRAIDLRGSTSIPLLMLAFLFVGCGDPSTAKRGEVSGIVTLDGKPIEKGAIVFVPMNGTPGPTAGAEIHDGRYFVDRSMGPPVGDNNVQFRSAIYTGRKVPDRTRQKMIDEKIDLFPASLREDSKLVRKIEPGRNVIDFDLSTQPQPEQK